MQLKKFIWVPVFVAVSNMVSGQNAAPENWFNLDKGEDKIEGMSTEKAYKKLLVNKKAKPIIVGVLDSGVDEDHEDLKNIMWVNEDEIPGNNIDDDKNGYVDDIYGWNFIGGKDGKNVDKDSYELTRVYKVKDEKFRNMLESNMTDADKEEYKEFLKLKAEFLEKSIQAKTMFEVVSKTKTNFEIIENAIGKGENINTDDLKNYKPSNSKETAIINKLIGFMESGITYFDLKKEVMGMFDHYDKLANYAYNLNFDPRYIVGDDYNNQTEKYYGNNDVTGPDASHGTHVAGIIAAQRDNYIGIKGVANNVRIMSVRCVPDGDERDKDVANAIIYAVDNGAKVINMSFGKSFPWNKKIVDDAVKYAESKDVLLVHGAGNDGKDIDVNINYPNPNYNNENKRAQNWIEVGAYSWIKGKNKIASFSNYGKKNVDVFAPGVSIYSTTPGSNYESFDGTSMASPCTAGVAALIRAYFPDLTASQVRNIIMKSTVKVKGKVNLPGSNKTTKLKKISVTGGFVNTYKALKLADKMSKY
ncbi:MAG: S8 family serine peptidase [Bacteroidetes bacterium]|nr:S8 family serine peptidase [Bacteroidota bacterium]